MKKLSALAIGLAACGAPAAQTQPPVGAAPSATAETPVAPVSPAVDISAVDAPRSLVFLAHVAQPNKLLSIAGSWAQTPLPDAEYIATWLAGRDVGDILDLDQAGDIAFAVQGKGLGTRRLMATSVAVRNGDEARAAFAHFRMVELGDGAVRIHPEMAKSGDNGGDPLPSGEDDRVCELGPAFGAAPVRLVCAEDDASLDVLAAYLRRTVPRGSYASDVHMDIRMAPVRDVMGGQSKTGGDLLWMLLESGPRSGPLGLLAQSAIEFAFDLDTIGVDLQLATTQVDGTATLSFTGSKSALTRLATAHPERTDVAPAAFWQLPVDANAAFFIAGIDEATFDPARDALADSAGDVLREGGVPDGDRAGIVAALKEMTTPAPTVYASGLDVQATMSKLTRADALQYSGGSAYADAARDAIEALLGWRVFGLDEPPSKFATAARDLASAWSSSRVAQALKRYGAAVPAVKIVPVPFGAPRGSTHLEVDLFSGSTSFVPSAIPMPVPPPPPPPPPPTVVPYPNPPPVTLVPVAPPPPVPPRPVRVHVLFVADGARTWAVVACDPATLSAKMRVVLPGGAPSDRLGARTDLDALKNGREGAGGYFSVLSTATLVAQLRALFEGDVDEVAPILQKLAPGLAPMPFQFTSQSDGKFVAALHLGPQAVDDLRRGVMALIH